MTGPHIIVCHRLATGHAACITPWAMALAPVLALNNIREQPVQPHQKPGSSEMQLHHEAAAPMEPDPPDYAALARNTPFLLPAWSEWVTLHRGLIEEVRYQPAWFFGSLRNYLSRNAKNLQKWHRIFQARLLRPVALTVFPQARFPHVFHVQPFIGAGSHAAPPRVLVPGMDGFGTRLGPYPQNHIDVLGNTNLHIELRHGQGRRDNVQALQVRSISWDFLYNVANWLYQAD